MTTVNLLVKYREMSSPRDAISAISSAVHVPLDVFGIALFFLAGRFPGRDKAVKLAAGVMPDLEDHGTEAAAAPTYCETPLQHYFRTSQVKRGVRPRRSFCCRRRCSCRQRAR